MHISPKLLRIYILSSIFLSTIAPIFPIAAQITPDNTLGAERSRLDSNVLINNVLGDRINGGAIRDRNLFHSFSEFNINDGQRVYFSNPSGVLNILTRVTGGMRSNILGTLGVDGNANLFLINPNGILFGKNASLDVRGSFVGTTANGLQFGNQGVFSATNPQAPALLTVNPSALVFSQLQANAGITNQSQAPAGINPDGNPATGLRVPDGKSLLLVGGNINSDGGRFRAYDGRVELTGLTAPGDIGLNVAGDSLNLNIPNDVTFADVFLGNVSAISVFGDRGGEIVINARNIGIDNSFLFAGISAGKGTATTQAKDINLNATGAISISQSSFIDNSVSGNGNAGNVFLQAKDTVRVDGSSGIFSNVDAGGIGNAGNINIRSGSLSLNNGASLSNGIFARGNAGNISLEVSDGIQLSNAFIFNNITAGGVGNGGEININAGSLSLTDSSQIQSKIEETTGNLPGGQGNTGNININVKGNISFSKPRPGNLNGIATQVGIGGIGNAGNLTINAGSLEIKEGSEIQGSTRGKGNAGNITINTRDSLILDGRDGDTGTFSRILSAVQPNAEGNAGNINITTNNLNITNGAFLSSGSLGKGDAGSITVDVRDTTKLENGGFITTNVFRGIGKGGDIRLSTGTLSMTAGSGLFTNSVGEGDAGNIIVNARDTIKLDDVTGNKLTGIQSSLLTGGVGKGGNIDITTGSLFALNGAILLASSDGQGDAGNITINARDVISFDTSEGNKFKSSVGNEIGSNAVGNGGDIRITAREISFKNGSKIGASSFGQGNAGNILIDASDKVSFDGVGGSFQVSSGADTSTSKTGNGGDIAIKTGTLSLTNGAQINASTYGNGNGGNITIDARDRINFSGISSNERFSGVYSLVEKDGVGNAGNIKLTTNSLSLSNRGRVSAATFGRGNAGDITINASDITVNDAGSAGLDSGVFSTVEATGVGKGGNININTGSLSISDRAFFNASTSGEGNAGDITVNASGKLSLTGTTVDGLNFNSGIFTTVGRDSKLSGQGKGGNINITARDLSLNGSAISASSIAEGTGGNLDIKAGTVRLNNQSAIASITNSGNGGNINLTATDYLLLRRGSFISTTAGLQKFGGDGGNITLSMPFIVAVPGENSDITANAFTGKGGNINIQTQGIFGIEPRVQTSDATNDITASSQLGIQGQISITNPEIDPTKGIIELPNDVVDATTQLSQLCPRGYEAFRKPLSSFTITGRDALPQSPLEALSGTASIPLVTLDDEKQGRQEDTFSPTSNSQLPTPQIIEAQGWVKTADGAIALVAQVPKATPSSQPKVSPCPQQK